MAEIRGTKIDDSQIRSTKLENLVENAGHFQKPVNTAAELPATGQDGQLTFVKSEKVFYVFETATGTWGQTNSNQDAINANFSDLETALTTETNARTSVDTALETRVSGLETQVQEDIATAISAEETARTAADTALANRTTALETEVSNAHQSNTKSIDGGVTPREFASVDARLEEIEADHKTEVTRASNAESTLQTAIDTVSGNLTAEQTARSTKDTELSDKITAVETTLVDSKTSTVKSKTFTSLDARLEENENDVKGEIANRQSEITRVEGLVTTEKSRATSEEARIEGKVDKEVTDRQAAITGVQDQITATNSAKADKNGNVNENFSAKDLTVGGNILPTGNSTQDIGSPTNRFRGLYVDEAYLSTNTLYLGDTPVMGTSQDTVEIKADPNQSINIKTTGTGLTQITSVNGVELSTSGMNGDVKVQATGQGARVVMSATNEVEMSATNINLTGAVDITGATAVDVLTVRGNLNVAGTTTTVSSQSLTVKDNIIEVNQGEVGTGVTLGQAGLKVDRGDAADYYMVFDEADDMFKVGMVGNLETIASQPFVNTKTGAVQTDLDNYKTANDTRITAIETTNTSQGNRIGSVETEITNARNGQTSLDARLDALDTTVSGKLGLSANAVSASKLATARTISLAGDVTGSVSFDGSADASITAVVEDDSHNHTISTVTGLQTALDGKSATGHTHAWTDITSGKPTTLSGYDITDAVSNTAATAGMFGKLMVHHNNGIWGTSPLISLAMGDNDTGFNWVSDGVFNIMTDGQISAQITKAGGIDFKKLPTINGSTIWNAGNDGAGSGLDADKIDGKQLTDLVQISAKANDVQLTSTTKTTVATFTPTVKNNFVINTYYRVVNANTNVTIEVSYTDASEAQVIELIAGAQVIGSYTIVPVMINAMAGFPININVIAGDVNNVFVSTSITEM